MQKVVRDNYTSKIYYKKKTHIDHETFTYNIDAKYNWKSVDRRFDILPSPPQCQKRKINIRYKYCLKINKNVESQCHELIENWKEQVEPQNLYRKCIN